MGLGTEILFLMVLGLVFLGPKQMHTLLRRIAKAKAQFDHATRDFKSQLTSELEGVASESAGPASESNPRTGSARA